MTYRMKTALLAATSLTFIAGGTAQAEEWDIRFGGYYNAMVAYASNDAATGNGVDDTDGLGSVQHRHGQVNQHQIGFEGVGQCDCLLAVLGLGNNLETIIRLENTSHAETDHRVIVGNQNSDSLVHIEALRFGGVITLDLHPDQPSRR